MSALLNDDILIRDTLNDGDESQIINQMKIKVLKVQITSEAVFLYSCRETPFRYAMYVTLRQAMFCLGG